MSPTRKTLLILTGNAILFGSIFLIWFYFIDGIYFDKPITFIHGVNPLDLKLDKPSYAPGETPSVLTAFCKNRDSSPSVQWTLVDGQTTGYAPHTGDSHDLPVGCYPAIGSTTEIEIDQIPPYYYATCDAYFVGRASQNIGSGRVISYTLRTEKFCIK